MGRVCRYWSCIRSRPLSADELDYGGLTWIRTHEFCSIMLLRSLTCGYCSGVTGIPDEDKHKSMSASHKPQTSSFRELKSGFIWIDNAFGWIDDIHNKLWTLSCESETCSSKHAMHLQQTIKLLTCMLFVHVPNIRDK